jgi:F-type H+-transporting ATPase subunit delta
LTSGALAKRYARALVGALPDAAALEAAGRDLEAFAGLVREQRDLRALFANPGVQRRDKEAILDRIMPALALSPMVTSFLRLLLEKGRLGQIESIQRVYRDLMDARLGRVRAEVRSAVPLDEAVRARLAERLAAVAGKTVVVDAQTDPSLLAGLVARIGDTVYDGSLRTQLHRLREALVRE